MKTGRIVINFSIFVSTKFQIKVIQVIVSLIIKGEYLSLLRYIGHYLFSQHASNPMVLSTLKYCEMIHTWRYVEICGLYYKISKQMVTTFCCITEIDVDYDNNICAANIKPWTKRHRLSSLHFNLRHEIICFHIVKDSNVNT